MPLKEAALLCPDAVSMASNFLDAQRASTHIENLLKNHAPIIEKMSVDEWFVDLRSLVGGIPQDLIAWGKEVQREVQANVGLSVSAGIAPTKLLAKMASEYQKPAGVTAIGDQKGLISIEAFLADRPAAAIPGIGSKRKTHADLYNWTTALDVAKAPKETIIHLFGRPGLELQQELSGIALWAVEEDTRPPKSISRCRSFRRTTEKDLVLGFILQHTTHCIRKMRRHHLSCTHVSVWVRGTDYAHASRARKLPQPLDTEDEIIPYIQSCFARLYHPSTQYTQVGICLSGLQATGGDQYSLFESTDTLDKAHNIQDSLDEVRKRYGRDSIMRGRGVAITKTHRNTKSSTPTIFGNIEHTSLS